MDRNFNIGALISGSGTNLQAIIDSCETGKIKGKLAFVGSDNPDAKGLERARRHKIPTFVVDYSSIIKRFGRKPDKAMLPDDFNFDNLLSKQAIMGKNTTIKKTERFIMTRAIAEKELLDKMKPYPFDLLVLAGFMRNLTPYFIDRVNVDPNHPRIMNIHPALLPAFPGNDGYGDTFKYGCKVGGCSVHFIDYGEDSGPIIGQKAFKIENDDTLDTMKKKGLKLEWELYPKCIQLFAENKLKIIKVPYTLKSGKKRQRPVVKIL
ncbi:MAG: phosphoribosylglycinamide formyltransferase [Deltaproteobacteria bacterium]|nr:phosphoribosylglycinamide formyltransferase [Deltaproteobacteria bacterium]MBT8373865.1 phosphoribosylglycinamide formyltransferase [Deltaproteobacteria bacterium]